MRIACCFVCLLLCRSVSAETFVLSEAFVENGEIVLMSSDMDVSVRAGRFVMKPKADAYGGTSTVISATRRGEKTHVTFEFESELNGVAYRMKYFGTIDSFASPNVLPLSALVCVQGEVEQTVQGKVSRGKFVLLKVIEK